jgi:hypothetical protein
MFIIEDGERGAKENSGDHENLTTEFTEFFYHEKHEKTRKFTDSGWLHYGIENV